ncbi:MAG: NAD(P)-dependent oxidoreductase [Chloroflexota bacterium]
MAKPTSSEASPSPAVYPDHPRPETIEPGTRLIGFIGLGTMGGRLAARLLAGGCHLLVYDRVPDAVARVVSSSSSAVGARSADQVIAAADVVFTSLPAPDDVDGLYVRPDGVSSAVHRDQILVDLSTIDPTTARHVAEVVASRGAAFLDAPVSGGVKGAEAGTLTIMVGGEGTVLERVRPLLALFSERVVHIGPPGTGSAVKLANQLLVAANTITAMEAVGFASRFGVDPFLLLDVLGSSAGDSRMLRRSIRDFVLTRDFTPAFALRLLVKDLRLYLSEAHGAGVVTPSGAPALASFEQALAAGLGDQDYAAILKLIAPQAD